MPPARGPGRRSASVTGYAPRLSGYYRQLPEWAAEIGPPQKIAPHDQTRIPGPLGCGNRDPRSLHRPKGAAAHELLPPCGVPVDAPFHLCAVSCAGPPGHCPQSTCSIAPQSWPASVPQRPGRQRARAMSRMLRAGPAVLRPESPPDLLLETAGNVTTTGEEARAFGRGKETP